MTDQPKQSDTQPTGGPGQRARWLMYGSNVAIFCIAAVAITVIVNWLSATQLAGRGEYTRFDLTATRAYSLSPQTRQLLQSLDTNVHIVLLYSAGTQADQMMDKIEDLLDEYRSRSSNIDVQHIDPPADPPDFDALVAKLLARYDDEVKTTKSTIEEAKKLFIELGKFADKQQGPLGDLFTEVDPNDPASIKTIRDLAGVFRTTSTDLERFLTQIDSEFKKELPDYGLIANGASRNLAKYSSGVFRGAILQFRRAAEAAGTSDKGKDTLLGMVKQYEAFKDRIDALVEKFEGSSLKDYNALREKLNSGNAVVIYTDAPEGGADASDGRGVTAMTLDEIYPVQNLRMTEEGAIAIDRSYVGEETITGAVIKLTSNHNTKIVIVNPNRAPVLTGRGQETYSTIAARLRSMNFIVEEWQPGGQAGPGGRPMPPSPAPTADPGQTMVFVALADLEQPNPQMPMNPSAMAANRALAEHISAGGPALVMTAPAIFTGNAPQDAMAPLLEPFGVKVDRNRLIITRLPGQGGQLVNDSRMEISDYPGDHPIAKAARGLNGFMMYGQPIEIAEKLPEGVTVTPIARSPKDAWGESQIMQLEQAKRDPDDPEGPIDIAVAVEADKQRLVVMSTPMWGFDSIVAARNQAGAAAVPGNGELMVNAIYWLAGQDEMIAPGARSQDVRRIADIEPGVLRGVWWGVLAGLPVLCLLLGVVVYTIRRR